MGLCVCIYIYMCLYIFIYTIYIVDGYIYYMVDERLMVIYNHFGVDIIWNVQKTYSKKTNEYG